MQTVCAHCYRSLHLRQQRLGCILCPICEQNWASGKRPNKDQPLPEWVGDLGVSLGKDIHPF